jgi:hypothetical protein
MLKINDKILGYLILILVVSVTSVIGFYIAKKIEMSENPPEIVIQPSEYPDWDAIKGKNPDSNIRRILVTKDCPQDGCKSDKPATQQLDAIDKYYKVKGRFSRAYLYTEAIVDYRRPLTKWDDIYFNINNFGGHLINDENLLSVPPGENSIYLYDFRSISYYPTIEDKENRENRNNNINIFYLLQDGIELDIRVFISSDRPGRIMKEVSIYYECFEGSDCSIEEINK